MASRMSNRDRIQRMAQEAEAKKKAKAKKATSKKTTKKKAKKAAPRKAAAKTTASRKKKASKGRVKIVWTVCIPGGRALKVFPYREKAEAEAEAKKLTEKKGTLHVVKSDREPMEDDE